MRKVIPLIIITLAIISIMVVNNLQQNPSENQADKNAPNNQELEIPRWTITHLCFTTSYGKTL
jgi:hypothetical protein